MDDGYLLKIRNLLVFWLVVGGTLLAAFFMPEMRDSMKAGAKWVSGEDAGVRLPAGYQPKAGDFVLRPERNDIERIRVSAVRVESFDGRAVTISFDLANLGGDNAHPNLTLSLLRPDGSVARKTTLAAGQYPHAKGTLKQEVIRLTVPVQAGEASVRVEPFYEGGAKK
jgi:hypothetical protein